MALPPTYLAPYISEDPRQTYQLLRRGGLLKISVASDPSLMIKALTQTADAYDHRNPMPGPTLSDKIASSARPFLCLSGQMFASTILYRASPLRKALFLTLRIWCRIKSLFLPRRKV